MKWLGETNELKFVPDPRSYSAISTNSLVARFTAAHTIWRIEGEDEEEEAVVVEEEEAEAEAEVEVEVEVPPMSEDRKFCERES
jgi:hypothetical protein